MNNRATLISSILSALERNVRRKNQRMVEQGGQPSDQVAFDRVDTFFRLAFISDKGLRAVADVAL